MDGVSAAAAFKGGTGNGTFGTCKGKGGKGKGKQGYYNNKRSLNYASESDYQAAWNTESEWNPEEGDGNGDYYDYNIKR